MVLLQIPLAVATGTVIRTNAVTELLSVAVQTLLQAQWKEEKVPKEKIEEALKKRILHFGNTSSSNENPYAKSPILTLRCLYPSWHGYAFLQ
jgi:hypothetical protein